MPIPDVSDRTISDLISLEGRAAVVTGAARGIGRAIAARLSEAGAAVVVADIDEAGARAVASHLSTRGGRAVAFGVDISDRHRVGDLASFCVSEYGRLDVWVNNAGIYPRTPVMLISAEEWDRVVNVNLYGTFYGSRAAAEHMIDSGREGVIINVASTASFRGGPPGFAHYVSSKHAIAGLTKSLALELGSRGIRVLAVAPTRVYTEGLAQRVITPQDEEERRAVAASGIGGSHEVTEEGLPLGRAGVPDDVARVALFCASDLSMLMTGSVLAVDAGALAD